MTRRVWLGFAVLCLLGGSAWVFDEALPAMLSGLFRLATHNLALGAVFGLLAWLGKAEAREISWWKVAAAAIAMIAVPEILAAVASGSVSQLTEVLLYMLIPVVVMVAVAQKAAGFGADGNPLRMIVPALAGVGGAALIIPATLPPTVTGRLLVLAMGASAILAGLAAVWLHELLVQADVLRAAAVVAGSSGAVAGAFCWIGWLGIVDANAAGVGVEALRCLVFEGPILLLTVWLLREMRPVAFSARLLVIPLVTILESYVLLRPAVTWTTAAGVLLMAGGCAALLRGADSHEML
jgi:drug/metabolite transporter (DMT)-like permease